ncbi:uncharacterized protein FA14DRAFT_185179 [Meira miltonrushii]|uniref:Uncharacterized protein n=1 Tax=Meira miltonrushii TaxID=1280837 RepID=A0A316V866_9BASI|nr:uncharacterized protein FA14DRAFT_185179 [Meira miltonrushii]PWN33404.1 hypothetical protein FA14DRAFT_185179 [Meira miltonrushii]
MLPNFLLHALLLATAALAARDPSYPACDTNANDHKMTKTGTGYSWYTTDDPVEYVAPGTGSCAYTYTDQSLVACLNPGQVNSAIVNGCHKWIELTNPANGIVAQAMVGDACGAVPNSTFGCNDVYLSKEVFVELAGDDSSTALQKGRLSGDLQWRFIIEPCKGCAMGYPGIFLNGTTDPCTGHDSHGLLRCGRSNLSGQDVNKVCNANVQTCPK